MSLIGIKTIGKFKMVVDDKEIVTADVLGRQLSSLLAFFIRNRTRIVTKDMLIEAFWLGSENPASAIKYAIHRLRNELSKVFEFDWIITSKMGYMLNPTLELQVDLERFEEEYRRITAEKDLHEVLQFKEADLQYLEEFDDDWILSVRDYYNEMCNKMIIVTCENELSKNQPDFATVIHVCKRALDKDPYSETIILYYCMGLIETREYNKALSYFEKMTRKFNDELGIPLGEDIKKLFLGDNKDATRTVRIDEIPKEFEEDLLSNGPLYCTQIIFKKLFQLYVRKARRDKVNYHIIIFEIKELKGKQTSSHENLESVIVDSLRRTDIYTNFITNNFGLLVELKNTEDIFVVIDRIQKKFYSKVSSKNARLNYYESSLINIKNINIIPDVSGV